VINLSASDNSHRIKLSAEDVGLVVRQTHAPVKLELLVYSVRRAFALAKSTLISQYAVGEVLVTLLTCASAQKDTQVLIVPSILVLEFLVTPLPNALLMVRVCSWISASAMVPGQARIVAPVPQDSKVHPVPHRSVIVSIEVPASLISRVNVAETSTALTVVRARQISMDHSVIRTVTRKQLVLGVVFAPA